MIKIHHLVRSAITLGHSVKAAADRRDRDMLLRAYEEQAKILETIEKMIKELQLSKKNDNKPKH